MRTTNTFPKPSMRHAAPTTRSLLLRYCLVQYACTTAGALQTTLRPGGPSGDHALLTAMQCDGKAAALLLAWRPSIALLTQVSAPGVQHWPRSRALLRCPPLSSRTGSLEPVNCRPGAGPQPGRWHPKRSGRTARAHCTDPAAMAAETRPARLEPEPGTCAAPAVRRRLEPEGRGGGARGGRPLRLQATDASGRHGLLNDL